MISLCAGRRRRIGENTREILAELGLAREEIDALIKRGVVAAGEAS